MSLSCWHRGVLTTAQKLIPDANQKIRDHNAMVKNLASERINLTSQVWARFAKVEIDSEFKKYGAEKANLMKAIDSLVAQISTAEKDKTAKAEEIQALERSITSIQPTVNDINKILKGFGFRNFSIEATDSNHYRIRREDGTDAKETLSEGERSFITFLYFYHLLKGNDTSSRVTRDRVVVFDDPVSSLDSDILFVVCSLIRQLLADVRKKQGQIKQVFVLTHNVYFHKEITYNKDRTEGKAFKDETFWTIRKVNGLSTIQNHKSNPITTAYALLWSEVREKNLASQTIQNTLRRILEHYFRILGGISYDGILDKFDGEDKIICNSLSQSGRVEALAFRRRL